MIKTADKKYMTTENERASMQKYIIPESHFPIEIDKNIFVLGNYFFNLFLVVGQKKSALFEVGVSAISDRVISQLETLGVSPDYIIISHPHSDHVTGLPALMARYPKAGIVAATGAKEFIEHPKAAPVLIREDRFMSQNLDKLGIKPGRPTLQAIPDVSGIVAVEDETSLDLGGITLDLKKVEGHSPGNLSGRLNRQKILFCSDSIGFHFPKRGFIPIFFTGAQQYLATLNDIKDFNPAIICPGHQCPLEGKDATAGILESLNTTLETIQWIKTSDLSDEALAQIIFERSYKDEFTLYTEENIKNCASLIVKRAKELPCSN
jgi:glyoxylase-like metal-dependent hydrolase (beta-lactamase superfamily II)